MDKAVLGPGCGCGGCRRGQGDARPASVKSRRSLHRKATKSSVDQVCRDVATLLTEMERPRGTPPCFAVSSLAGSLEGSHGQRSRDAGNIHAK